MSEAETFQQHARTLERERDALVKKIALQREAIRALLQDHIRRYVASSGVSYPLQTPKGRRREPDFPTNRLDIVELLQRECDQLDKAGNQDSRFDVGAPRG